MGGVSYSSYLLESDPAELERRRKKRQDSDKPAGLSQSADLVYDMQRQQEELALRQQEDALAEDKDPGIIGKVFDVISRPNYAIANTVKSVTSNDKDKTSDSILKSFGTAIKEGAEGLTGKDKTIFADVLEQEGMGGGWQRSVLGLGLDVVLDPTTYLSLGTSAAIGSGGKVGAKLAGKTAAAKAARETLEKGGELVGKKVTTKLLDEFVAKGLGETAEHLSETGAKKLSARILQDEAYEAALKVQDNAAKEVTPTFGLKVLGKEIPGMQSQTLYDTGSKLSEAFKATAVGKGLNQTFKTTHLFPGPLRNLKREAEGFSYAQFSDMETQIRSAFRGVSKEDKRLISHAIETGDDLSGLTAKNGVDLGDLQKEALDWRDSITEVELTKGFLKPEDLQENYLYHHYMTSNREGVKEFKAARKAGAKAKQFKTLQDAAAAGLKPVQEIDDVLLLRAGKSYKEQGRAAFADSVSREFGVGFAKHEKGLATQLGLERTTSRFLKGADESGKYTYLPKEVNQAIKHMDGLYDSVDETNQLLRMFDKSLSHWKFGATAINPGHHIRNAVGDMFLNTMDGVTNPYRYLQSEKVLSGVPTKIKVGSGTVSGEQLRNYYKLKGVKSGYTRVEIGARKFAPTEKIREFAEAREDWTRMAHFIDAFKKEAKDIDPSDLVQMDKAASRAGARVRKFNIDYGDLTDVEKKVFKRVVPFYTWMRKNIPIQLEALALTPGRQAIVPKSIRAIQGIAGGDGEEYPTIGGLNTVPKWLREMSGIKIIGEGQGRNGVYMDPSTLVPSMDALSTIGAPINALMQGEPAKAVEELSSEALNMTNPLIRGTVEMGTGRNTFTGGARDDNFLANQLPATRLLSGLASGETDKWDMMNYLTGSSMREIGEPQKMGELRRQQDIIEGGLRRSGGVAADMLQQEIGPVRSRYEDIMAGRTPVQRSDETLPEAQTRVQQMLNDLRGGGQNLALLKKREKDKKKTSEMLLAEQDAEFRSRVG